MFRKNVASQSIFFAGVNATTGAALAGLTITAKVTIDSAGTQATGVGTLTDLTNGQYRYVPTQAETNGNQIGFMFTATNMVPWGCTMVTTAADPTDVVRFGLTAFPAVVSGSAGAIPTTGTGANQLSVTSGQVILQTGTGTGQLDFTAGVVKANTTQFAGQTVTAAAGVTLPTSVASPTNITAGVITTVTNLTNAPGAGDFTATMKTSLNAATPASVVGAVGSVAGAVGSVTADVGITQAAADKVFGASGAALAELAQAQPSATPSPATAMMLLYMALRNNLTTTASTKSVFNNAGTVIAKKALTDDGTTYTETKMVTGP